LQAIVQDLFQLDQAKSFRITYTDEDGDHITIGCDEDVLEAVRVASLPSRPLLRLCATSEAAPSKPAESEPAPEPTTEPDRPKREAPKCGVGGMLGMLGGLASNMANQSRNQTSETLSDTPRQNGFDLFSMMQQAAPMVQKMQAEFEKHYEQQPVHYGIACDVTGMSPIVGTRYKKLLCDYDLCQEAFDQLTADERKEFIQVDTPADAARIWEKEAEAEKVRLSDILAASLSAVEPSLDSGRRSWSRTAVEPEAEPSVEPEQVKKAMKNSKMGMKFLEDVSLPDGIHLQPGTILSKVWRVVNCGPEQWPADTRLQHVDGSLFDGSEPCPVPQLESGQECELSLHNMTAPVDAGQYKSSWRLSTPAGEFGDFLWFDVSVVEANSAQGEARQQAALEAEKAVEAELEAEMARIAAAEEAKAQAARLAVERVAAKAALAAAEEAAAARLAAEEAAKAAAAEAARVAAEEAAKAAAEEAARVAAEEAAKAAAEDAARVAAEEAAKAAAEDAARAAEDCIFCRASAGQARVAAEEAAKPKAGEGKLPVEWQFAMDALVQMGFDPNVAQAQVAAAEGDLQVALEAALSCVPPPPPPPSWNAKWDSLMGELAEMGFEDEEANKRAITANDGILKDTVTALVAEERAARRAQ
jgi:hypothetical protein